MSYEFAWAAPDSLDRGFKLSPETLLTREDRADSFARTAAKYFEVAMTRSFKRSPLASVEKMLERVKSIASYTKVDGRKFEVNGGATEGQVIVNFQNRYYLRYFNPKIKDLALPAPGLAVIQEYPLNDYLTFQFLKAGAVKAEARAENNPEEKTDDGVKDAAVIEGTEEPGLFDAYRTVMRELKETSFAPQEYADLRDAPGKAFTYAQAAAEIKVLTALGILREDNTRIQRQYRLRRLFAQDLPELAFLIHEILSGLGEKPASGEIAAARAKLDNYVNETGIRATAEIAASRFTWDEVDPLVQTILLYWPDRDLTPAERTRIKALIPRAGRRESFDRACGRIHRVTPKNGSVPIEKMLPVIIPDEPFNATGEFVPEGAREKDVSDEESPLERSLDSISEALRKMPQWCLWVAGLYYGFPGLYLKAFEAAKDEASTMRALFAGRDAFFANLPPGPREQLRKKYAEFVEKEAGPLKGTELADLLFVKFISRMGEDAMRAQAGKTRRKSEQMARMYLRERRSLKDIVEWSGEKLENVRMALRRVLWLISAGLPRDMRIAAMKDDLEDLYLIKLGGGSFLCDNERLEEVVDNFRAMMEPRYEKAKELKGAEFNDEYDRLHWEWTRFFGNIEYISVARNGAFRLSGQFAEYFGNTKSLVIVENPRLRFIEIWPVESVDERPYDYMDEGRLSTALETIANSRDRLAQGYFTKAAYGVERKKVSKEKPILAAVTNELETLVRLGILSTDEDTAGQKYAFTPSAQRAPPVRFKLMAAMMRGLKGYPSGENIKRIEAMLDHMEKNYGWELLESVTSSKTDDDAEIRELENRIFSIFDMGILKGNAAFLAELKKHEVEVARIAERMGKAAGQNTVSVALLRVVAAAHDLGKGISAANLALHYSTKLKKDMTAEERARLEGHEKDSLKLLVQAGIELPPEAVMIIGIDHEEEFMAVLKELNPELWNTLVIFNVTDQFKALTEDRPYERDIKLPGAEAVHGWLGAKFAKGTLPENVVRKAETILVEELPSGSPSIPGEEKDEEEKGGTVTPALAILPFGLSLTPDAAATLVLMFAAVVLPLLAANLWIYVKTILAERRMHAYLSEKDPQKKLKLEYRFDVKNVEGGDSIRVASGIRVFGYKDPVGGQRTTILFSSNASLLFVPFKITVEAAQAFGRWWAWTVLKLRLGNNTLFVSSRVRSFVRKNFVQPFHKDFLDKFASACAVIEDLKGQGCDLAAMTDGADAAECLKAHVAKDLTLGEALKRVDRHATDAVYYYLYRKLGAIDLSSPDPQKLQEVNNIVEAIRSYSYDPYAAAKKGWIKRAWESFRGLFLALVIMLLMPLNNAWAAPDLQYTYYPSGRIQTETYMSDWDGDTPADPSDDVPAGTVIRRLDEPFYDPGTPVNPNDDYGRIERRTDPDGNYSVFQYSGSTATILFIRRYDPSGSLVFTQETVVSDLAVRAYTDGRGETYSLILGKEYLNSARGADGTVRTFIYDGSWNLVETYVYRPDKRLERFIHAQGIVEDWTPGWDFARGANLPWVKYGYDIGDGSHGEDYEGLSTKKAQLLTELRRWKGGHLRAFIFCDLRSGITFDGGGSPTGLSTHVYDDMDALLEQARALGIKVMPVLLDFMVADGVSMEGSNPVGEYPGIITDPAKRAAFLNVMGTFVSHYAGRSEIVAWDIINEPEEIPESTSVTMNQVQAFLTEFASRIKTSDPGKPVTVGARNRETMVNNWTGVGLTLYSPHYYDYMLPWFPLTDPLSVWGSGLDGPVVYGELEPTGVTTKLAGIFASGVDGGMFWQDATFTLDNTEAENIRTWRDSFIVRPFPPVITSVYAYNGNRSFSVSWQPYTGNLQGSVTGYTINIGGREFFVSGVLAGSVNIDLPDDIYSGNYGLSIRTEMPDGQYDSDYSDPVTVHAGRSPDEEDRGCFGCSVASVGSRDAGTGWFFTWTMFIAAILFFRFHGFGRGKGPEPGTPPAKRPKKPPLGSIYEAFKTLMAEGALKNSPFTLKTFREYRKNAKGEPFSESCVRTEIKGLVALGILIPDRTKKVHTYALNERYGRAPPEVIEAIKRILEPLPADPAEEQLAAAKSEIEGAAAGEKPSNVIFDRTYPLDDSPSDLRAWFFGEVEKDISRFAAEMRGGGKLSSVLREVLMNAFDGVVRKYENLGTDERASFKGWVRFSVQETFDSFYIKVTDSGAGIGFDSRGVLTERAEMPESTKGPGQGGSGLSYVNAMLRSSGGMFGWSAAPEGGTLVQITLPIEALDADHVRALRQKHVADTKGGSAEAKAGKTKAPAPEPKSRSEAIRTDKDLLLYFLRELPKLDLELIRLSAERADLQRTKARGDAEKERKEKLARCLSRLSELKGRINSEILILSPSVAPADIRNGRDYRREAREKLKKALAFIEARNESAACALICASACLLSEEFALLVKAEARPRRKARVWFDSKEHMHKVMQGQYVVREIEGGRSVPVRERGEHASQITWQAMRSCDDQLEGMLNELEWIKDILPQVGPMLDIMTVKAKAEVAATKDRFAQPKLTDDEKKKVEEVLAYISERTERAVVSEKEITSSAASLAKELLDRGRYRSMIEIMGVMKSMLEARARTLESMISAVGSGRLAEIRRMIHRRNSRLIGKIDRIAQFLDRGETITASNWLYGIARDKDVRNEPEFYRMLPVLWQAQGWVGNPDKEVMLKRNLEIFKQRVRLAELLDSFMEDFRDQYVEARLSGASSAAKETFFTLNFNHYLEFARENNIGRGSPRLLWAYFYLPAYVSMKMPNPEKPSEKIDNPLFPTLLDLVRLLEINDIALLARTIKDNKEKRFANLLAALSRLSAAGRAELDSLEREEFEGVLKALALDNGLNGSQESELFKVAALLPGAKELADVSRRGAYFSAMMEEEMAMRESGKLFPSEKEKLFNDLMEISRHPEKWRAEFTEGWEEAFVRENSALSSDELAEKFLGYFPEYNRVRKDLRNVLSVHDGEATLNDIYVNLLSGLAPGAVEKFGRMTRERIWILREWIYRHWDDFPKERSFNLIGEARSLRPPRFVNGGGVDLWQKFTHNLAASGSYSLEDADRIIREGIMRVVKGETAQIISQPRQVIEIYRKTLSDALGRDISLSEIETYSRLHESLHRLLTPEHVNRVWEKIKSDSAGWSLIRKYFERQHGEYGSEEEFVEELIVDYYSEQVLGNPVRLFDKQMSRRTDLYHTILDYQRGKSLSDIFDSAVPLAIDGALQDIKPEIEKHMTQAFDNMVIYRFNAWKDAKPDRAISLHETRTELLTLLRDIRSRAPWAEYTPDRFDRIFRRTAVPALSEARKVEVDSLFLFLLAAQFPGNVLVEYLERTYPTEYKYFIEHMRQTGKAADDQMLHPAELLAFLAAPRKSTTSEQITSDISHLFRNTLTSIGGKIRANARHIIRHHSDDISMEEMEKCSDVLKATMTDAFSAISAIEGEPGQLTAGEVRGFLEVMRYCQGVIITEVRTLDAIIGTVNIPEDQKHVLYENNLLIKDSLRSLENIINTLIEEMDFDKKITLEEVGGIFRQLVISQQMDFVYPRIHWLGAIAPVSGAVTHCEAGSRNNIAFRVYMGKGFYPVLPENDPRNTEFADKVIEARVRVEKELPDGVREITYIPMRYDGAGGLNNHDYIFRADFTPPDAGTYHVTCEARIKGYKGAKFPEEQAVWRPSINPNCTPDNPSGGPIFVVEKPGATGNGSKKGNGITLRAFGLPAVLMAGLPFDMEAVDALLRISAISSAVLLAAAIAFYVIRDAGRPDTLAGSIFAYLKKKLAPLMGPFAGMSDSVRFRVARHRFFRSDPVGRAAALKALGRCAKGGNREKVIDILMIALKDGDPAVVKAAADNMSHVIIYLLQDQDRAEVARAALRGAMTSPAAVTRSAVIRVLTPLAVNAGDAVRAEMAVAFRSYLTDTDPFVRASAWDALELLRYRNKDTALVLTAALGSVDSGVRGDACTWLYGMPGNLAALDALASCLSDQNPRVRMLAAITVHGIISVHGKDAVDEHVRKAITGAIGDKEPEIRALMAETAGMLEEDMKEAVPALLKCLRDKDITVTKKSVGALARIGITEEKDFIELEGLASDPLTNARFAAARVVKAISADITGSDVKIKGQSVRNIFVLAMMSMLSDRSVSLRQAATRALTAISASPVELKDGYMKMLGSSDPAVRENAIEWLGYVGLMFDKDSKERKAIGEALVERIYELTPSTSDAAVAALSMMGGMEEVLILNTVLREDGEDPRVYRAAATAVGSICQRLQDRNVSHEAMLSLLPHLATADQALRRTVRLALYKLKAYPHELAYAYLDALKSDNPLTRQAAAGILGELAGPQEALHGQDSLLKQVRDGLAAAMSDPDEKVRDYARRSLGMAGGTENELVQGYVLAMQSGKDEDTRRRAARVLSRYVSKQKPMTASKTRAVFALINALDDDSAPVRREAAGGLDRASDDNAFFYSHLFNGRIDGIVRGGAETVDDLASALVYGPEVATSAATALARIHDSLAWQAEQASVRKKIREKLEEALKAGKECTRDAARRALDEIAAAGTDPFAALDESVRGRDFEATRALAEKLGKEHNNLYIFTVRSPLSLDSGALKSVADDILKFGERAKKGLIAAGVDMERAIDISFITHEASLNIFEHARENLAYMGKDADVFGVVAVRICTKDGRRVVDIFTRDNGGGYDVSKLQERVTEVPTKGLALKSGRGIFLSAVNMRSSARGRYAIVSGPKALIYEGALDDNKAPVGRTVRLAEPVEGFLTRMTLDVDAGVTSASENVPLPDSAVKEKMRTIVPELVNCLITAASNNKKVILAIDEGLASGATREELAGLVATLGRLSRRDDDLGNFLKNVVIRQGEGEALAASLSSLVSRSDVHKEDVIVITSSDNLKYFAEFDGVSTITAINDKAMKEGFYYPLVELTLFTLARAVGYDKARLVALCRDIPNLAAADDKAILEMCWDAAANRLRTTVLVSIIPGAVKAEDKAIYREIGKIITTAA